MSGAGVTRAVAGVEVRVLLLLTFTAGVFDAVSFVGLDQVFVALITGNILLIGFALSEPGLTIGGPVVAIAAFFSRRRGHRAHRPERPQPRAAAAAHRAAEGLLLVPAVLLAIGYEDQELRRLLILAALGAAMGVRNETIREVALPELRTTLQTLALSAVATELARNRGLDAAGWERVGGILVQFAGAAIGGLLAYKTEIFWPLLMLLLINATAFLVLLRREHHSPPRSSATAAGT